MKVFSITIIAIGVLGLLLTSMIHFMNPREMTMTAIGETFYRIHLFAQSNNTLPKTFDELPRRENYGNRTIDGWGNELIYDIDDSGVVSLRSLGADAKPGGIGDNADLSRSYKWLDDNDVFIAADDLWIVAGELHDTD